MRARVNRERLADIPRRRTNQSGGACNYPATPPPPDRFIFYMQRAIQRVLSANIFPEMYKWLCIDCVKNFREIFRELPPPPAPVQWLSSTHFSRKRRQTSRPEKCLLSDIGGTFPIRHWQCKLASTCIMHARK